MKLILLRHEERDLSEPYFFTPLNEKGKLNSESKYFLQKIMLLKPDIIFCSPFERCIQTICKYCVIEKKNINIEYCLYEYIINNKFINEKIYNNKLIKNIYKPIINNNYISVLNPKDFKFGNNNIIIRKELKSDLYFRISLFLNKIINKYLDTNNTILLVTHAGVISEIEIYLNKIFLNFLIINRDIKMGDIREYNLKDYNIL